MKCPRCGEENFSTDYFCRKCGLILANPEYQISNSSTEDTDYEKIDYGLMIVCFFVPIVGFVLAIIRWQQQPKTAKRALLAAVAGIIISILSIFLLD